MIEVALITVILAGVAWVVLPLTETRRRDETANASPSHLVELKHAAYRNILDLEHDHALGKVSDGDYVAMRKQSEAEAISVIETIDAAGDARDILEEEIALARRRLNQRRGE